MEWFWIKFGIRWFTFSCWLHAIARDSHAQKGDIEAAEAAERRRKVADAELGLCLAKDLSRHFNRQMHKMLKG